MALRINVKSITFILPLILIVPVFSFASQDVKQPRDVKKIISKIIEAYGGKEKIESIKTFYAKGKINAIMRQDKGDYSIYFERDRKLRVELLYGRSSETRILNGSRGWRGTDKGNLLEVSDNRYLAMVFQFKRLDLPYGLLTNSYETKNAGSDVMNGKSVMVFELTDKEGPPMKLYIDSENFHIVKVSGSFGMKKHNTELSAEYSDFRVIEGMQFPHRIVNYAGGHKVGETFIEKYYVNLSLDVSLFKR